MASKIYTAQEMREEANKVTRYDFYVASDMLQQAADMMEREAKRDKRYEYSVHPADVYGVFQHRSAAELNVKTLKTIGIRAHLVRREVGEWEEVK